MGILMVLLVDSPRECYIFSSPTADDPADLLTTVMGAVDGHAVTLEYREPASDTVQLLSFPYNLQPLQNVYVTSTTLGEANAIGTSFGNGNKIDTNVLEVVPVVGTERGQHVVHEPQDPMLTFIRFPYKSCSVPWTFNSEMFMGEY